jgi:hypothetical protein
MRVIGSFLIFCLFINCSVVKQVHSKNELSYFYVIGDMPYEASEAEKYDSLIGHINSTNPLFTVHVGDTKSGHTDCSNESYNETKTFFNSFKQPLIYTPGDNEWTDCHQKDCGSYSGEERLAYLRETIFSDPERSLGQNSIKLTSQSSFEGFEKYVENSMWEIEGLLFSTVHVCGSSNNYSSPNGRSEFLEREHADLFWLDQAFKIANSENIKAVVIFLHANIFADERNVGYKKIRESLIEHTSNTEKPVWVVYGDFHTFSISKPLHHRDDNSLLKNFTALQVFGTPDIYPLKVIIDKKSDGLLKIEPVYLY